jgi:hypothetical protein
MSRFLQHILPRSFARVRTFGWLHPAAKVRANRVRALLREKPLLTLAEKKTWNLPADSKTETPVERANAPNLPARSSAPLCPRCHKAMLRVGSWQAGQRMLYPNRPP